MPISYIVTTGKIHCPRRSMLPRECCRVNFRFYPENLDQRYVSRTAACLTSLTEDLNSG